MTKKARKSQRVNSRLKGRRKIKADDSQPKIASSSSYINPGGNLAPKYLKGNDESEEGFPEGCNITRADFRTIMGSRMNTPLPRIGADSKLGNRIGTPSEKSVDKYDHFLPDINSHIPGRMVRRLDDHIVDADMYDVECIRKTQSGIAFTQFLGRPYRLPRLYSDGQIERRPQPRVNECASFVPMKQFQLNRSGGNFADKIRSEVEEKRQRREERNMERMRRQLQEWESRASRIGRSCNSNDERVRSIVGEQERIRRENFDKHVRKFMNNLH